MDQSREREIQDLIRRARQSPDKAGNLRRDALQRLIEATRSNNQTLKILAAGNIRCFFADFPDLEEAAINAVYDICEDQSPKVRIEGYNAITLVSKAETKWIKRNVDVLLQLLQSDEAKEVTVVLKALREHIDLDAKATLGVLCNELAPESPPIEGDELELREQLRSLVLAFMSGEGKRTIVRHLTGDAEAEKLFMDGLISSFPRLDPKSIKIIVQDILLSLPSLSSLSPRGTALLAAILQRAKQVLPDDLKTEPSTLDSTKPYLDLADTLIQKKVASPEVLLQFYYANWAPRRNLERLSPDTVAQILLYLGRSLQCCDLDKNSVTAEFATKRNRAVDACPIFFERMQTAHDKMSPAAQAQAREAATLLLGSCLKRKQEGWPLPINIQSAARSLVAALSKKEAAANGAGEGGQDLSGLLRSLTASDDASSKLTNEMARSQAAPGMTASSGSGARNSNSLGGQQHTPPRRIMTIAGKPRNEGSGSNIMQTQMTKSQSAADANASKKHRMEAGVGESTRPAKRVKQVADEAPPSLLSRINAGGSAAQQKTVPNKPVFSRPLTTSLVEPAITGLSIKGAAKVEANREKEETEPNTRRGSLLGRLGGDVEAGKAQSGIDEGRWDNDGYSSGNRRKKKR